MYQSKKTRKPSERNVTPFLLGTDLLQIVFDSLVFQLEIVKHMDLLNGKKKYFGKSECAFKRCVETFQKYTKSFGGKKVCASKWSLEICQK